MTALVGPLLLLGLLELIGFIWEQRLAQGVYAWELVASRRINLIEYAEPGAGYTLMKPGSHYKWGGITVDINSHGLRGPETPYSKPAGTFRILNCGDSVAMGWAVREQDSYGRQLEKLLNDSSGDSAQRYEVINGGAPGWNQDNALAFLQAEGLKYQPDLVLQEVTVVNDIYGGNPLEKRQMPLFTWLREHTYAWPFLSIQAQMLRARSQGKDRIDVLDPPTQAEAYYPQTADDPTWDRVWTPIAEMFNWTRVTGKRFILVVFPTAFQVAGEHPPIPQQVFTQRAAAMGIVVVDLLPFYQAACATGPAHACEPQSRYLFADVWMHPNAEGGRIAAEAIQTAILNTLAPEKHTS
jgi:hypothetical protein